MTTGDRANCCVYDRMLRELGVSKAAIPRAPRGEPIELSFAQSGLWFLDQLTPGSGAYNDHYALRVRGRLDVATLRRVLAEITRRHEPLRTTIAPGPEGFQVIHD